MFESCVIIRLPASASGEWGHAYQFPMNGQLHEQPLAELIREITSQPRDGALRLRHRSVKAVIYFETGNLVYAAANLRELRLAEYLRKQELLSAEQLQSIEDIKSDQALAAVLQERALLDQRTVMRLITKQVLDVLRVALLWTEGSWEFDTRAHLDDPLRVKVDVSSLLLQASRKIQPEIIAARLSNRAEVLSPTSDVPDSTALLPAEGFLFSRLETPLSLNDLVLLSGMREADAMRAVYGLALGGFVKRDRWPSALLKEHPMVATAVAEPAETMGEPVTADEPAQTLEAELDELLERLGKATTFYEILNLENTAAPEEIKNSYYSLARRYHPDRFHKQAGTPLHASVESAFARIAQAYMTLADPALRSSYNAKLAAREKIRQSAVEIPKQSERDRLRAEAAKQEQSDAGNELARAESSFQEGFIALQQGQTQAAVVSLAAAARLVPGEARFRAYYGRALAAAEDTRRLAETELQAALKLDPNNFNYRLMLAELYFDLGFFRRSEGELRRVLNVQPDNPGGRKLLRRLEAALA